MKKFHLSYHFIGIYPFKGIFMKTTFSVKTMESQKLSQDPQQIETILSTARFLHLALSDTENPLHRSHVLRL